MVFNDTTLVVVGDSFVYGHLGDDLNAESCHNRSWVRQLEKAGNFKTSVNLGAPGGSNYRSIRVLYEYLEQEYSHNEKYLVIFAVSELSRFELPVNHNLGRTLTIVPEDPLHYDTIHNEIIATGIGSWFLDFTNSKISDFVRMHYESFNHDIFSEKILRNSLFSLKAVLDDLNIESFFTSTVLHPEVLPKMSLLGKKLPIIRYADAWDSTFGMTQLLLNSGFKQYSCKHFDEHAYKFLAEYILEQINIIKGH